MHRALALAVALLACDARTSGAAPRPAPPSFAPVLKKLLPSVVNVFCEQETGPGKTEVSIGTGVILDAAGGFVTAAHIVRNAKQVKVELYDRSIRSARIIGADDGFDLALGAIEGPGPFAPAQLGDSAAAEVGDWVVAVGQPFSLPFSATAGIISAKGRTERDIPGRPAGLGGDAPPAWDFIQTDTSINQGNSGGPIANLAGEVIGINVMIHPDVSARVAFAIPADLVRAVVKQLKSGKVSRGWIGIEVSDARELRPADLLRLGLKESRGVLVDRITPGSPAAKAGLRSGDVILWLDGKKVEDWPELRWRISSAGIGTALAFKVWRGRAELPLTVVTAKSPAPKLSH